jgi:4-amino-4-deoxy-L-arabinose transferase-like glycosyltransferase
MTFPVLLVLVAAVGLFGLALRFGDVVARARPPRPAGTDPAAPARAWPADVAVYLGLSALAVLLGTWDWASSGPLWPDSPRYANGAAMIHDWLRAGAPPDPYRFAQENYRQYPAFSIPYHPPGYPALLALVFVATGVSYGAARLFVAGCLAACGCLFYALLRRLGPPRGAGVAGALLLLTMPEVIQWSRDTMSEVPALAFVLAGSVCFVAWVQGGRPAWCWLAFAAAEAAFFCRYTSAGILPAWFLFALAGGAYRRVFSRHTVAAALGYLAVNGAWVVFVSRFSRFETLEYGEHMALPVGSWVNLTFYPSCLPAMTGLVPLVLALAGAALALLRDGPSPLQGFWACWFVSVYAFESALSFAEQRYFFFALPAVPGLAASLLGPDVPRPLRRWAAPALTAVALAVNLAHAAATSRGVVGFDAAAEHLARLDRPGNVLSAVYLDEELIFRYRCAAPAAQRQFFRSDRTLCVRLPGYAGREPQSIFFSASDVVGLVRRGRIRYLATTDHSTLEDVRLAHAAAVASPRHFALLSQFPVRTDFGSPQEAQVYLWEFTGELPPGPSEFEVVIPTAGLLLR